jgi:hypothetical protein
MVLKVGPRILEATMVGMGVAHPEAKDGFQFCSILLEKYLPRALMEDLEVAVAVETILLAARTARLNMLLELEAVTLAVRRAMLTSDTAAVAEEATMEAQTATTKLA